MGACTLQDVDVEREGLRAKFTQSAVLFEQLRGTGDAIIVEAGIANPYWSCGVSPRNQERLKNPDNWTGHNVQGILLAKLRDELRERIYW